MCSPKTEPANGWSTPCHQPSRMYGGEMTGQQLTLADDTVETYLLNGQLSSAATRAGLSARDGRGECQVLR
jgi:hypothetical protein